MWRLLAYQHTPGQLLPCTGSTVATVPLAGCKPLCLCSSSSAGYSLKLHRTGDAICMKVDPGRLAIQLQVAIKYSLLDGGVLSPVARVWWSVEVYWCCVWVMWCCQGLYVLMVWLLCDVVVWQKQDLLGIISSWPACARCCEAHARCGTGAERLLHVTELDPFVHSPMNVVVVPNTRLF
jgi:hypothetical protein